MAAVRFRVEDRRFLYGCSTGLDQKTALVTLSVSGSFIRDAAADTALRERAVALNPAEPLHGVTDWPADLLLSRDGAVEADGEDLLWLGNWVVALTVAIQRWGHDPVFRGRVCGAGAGRLELAIPWAGQEFFEEALSLALRLVSDWLTTDGATESGPAWLSWLKTDSGVQATLDQYFDGRLAGIQSQGLAPPALRFIEAAVRRGMPFETLPNYVQIGWGANAERFDWALTGRTSWMALGIANDKAKTGRALAEAGIPVPRRESVGDADQMDHRLLVVRGKVLQVARCSPSRAEDVTEMAHPDNAALAARAARIVGLDIAGVDFLSPDISRSWHEVGGVICEVNGQPGFRPHWLADPDRDINGEVLDILFDGRPARVPTAAITGTNGKTTTAEMLYRIWTAAGKVTGVCTTERVRIGDQTVSTDNLSGQPGARLILNDPAVEAAVLEVPRKGLIYFGHHCDRYDVAALLNVQDDHIGVDGIESLEQMAELKAEVLERATGAIVVNAEDPLCLAMRARAGTDRHILVSRRADVEAVVEHRRGGGEAVFLDDRGGRPWIVLASGSSVTDLMPVHDVPATMDGLLAFNESNALFAAALAWAHGIDTEVIRSALSAFRNSVDHNPGRYNFIEGLPFDVLVDFAHNPDGVRGLCSVVAGMPVSGRRVLGSLYVGNRHPDHVDALAPLLAASFDEFVLSCIPDLVRECQGYASDDPITEMIARFSALLQERGVDPDRISCEGDPFAATRATLENARPGDLVVLLAPYQVHSVVEVWKTETGAGSGEARNR